jgi:hypothetical protein
MLSARLTTIGRDEPEYFSLRIWSYLVTLDVPVKGEPSNRITVYLPEHVKASRKQKVCLDIK